MHELALRPSKKRWVGFLAIFCAGIFIALVLEPPSVIRFLSVAFFCLGVLVSGLTLLPNSTWLKLTTSGFVTRSLFRTAKLVPWDVVDHFEAGSIPPAPGSRVLLNFVAGFKGLERGRGMSRAISGFDSALPDTYGMKAAALAELMNNWRMGHARPSSSRET